MRQRSCPDVGDRTLADAWWSHCDRLIVSRSRHPENRASPIVRQREIALRQSLGRRECGSSESDSEGLIFRSRLVAPACSPGGSRGNCDLLIPAVAPGPVIFPALTPDWTVIGYALVLAVLCTLAVTIGPALRTWSQPLLPFLKSANKRWSRRAFEAFRRPRRAAACVLGSLLLTSAGLAYRFVRAGRRHRRRLRHARHPDGDREHRRQRHRARAATWRSSRRCVTPARPHAAGGKRARDVPGHARLAVDRFSGPPRSVQRSASSSEDPAGCAGLLQNARRAASSPAHDFRARRGRNAGHAIITRELAATLWPGESAIGKVLVGRAVRPFDRAGGHGRRRRRLLQRSGQRESTAVHLHGDQTPRRGAAGRDDLLHPPQRAGRPHCAGGRARVARGGRPRSNRRRCVARQPSRFRAGAVLDARDAAHAVRGRLAAGGGDRPVRGGRVRGTPPRCASSACASRSARPRSRSFDRCCARVSN